MMQALGGVIGGVTKYFVTYFTAYINSQDKDGKTFLMKAIFNNDLNNAEYLLNNGANTELRLKNYGTALMIASSLNRLEFVKLLVKYGAQIDAKHVFGITALGISVLHEYFDITKYLLEKGADINKTSMFYTFKTDAIPNYKPLSFVINFYTQTDTNYIPIIKIFLSYNADINVREKDNKIVFNQISNEAEINRIDLDNRTPFDQIKDLAVKEQLRPYFDIANSVDHLVAGMDTLTEEDKVRLASIEDTELLEVAASRFKVALMIKLTDLPKITQKYLKTTYSFEKLKEIQRELNDENLNKFFNKILTEPTKFNKQEKLAAKLIIEEIAQLESMILSAKIYRAAGENEKKILTYDTLRTALEFNSNRDRAGVGVADASGSGLASLGADVISADNGLGTKVDLRAGTVTGASTSSSKDSPEIKAYKEMLAIYDANPNYKKVGYILQEAIGNLAELKKTFALLTLDDKTDFAAHLSNLLAKEPEIFLDEAKEALCELCGGIDITHVSLQEFTEHHAPHEPHAINHHAEDHHISADNIQLAGNAAGVGFAADNHD